MGIIWDYLRLSKYACYVWEGYITAHEPTGHIRWMRGSAGRVHVLVQYLCQASNPKSLSEAARRAVR